MRPLLIAASLAVVAALVLTGQRSPTRAELPAYDIQALFPHELSPGHYEQVQQRELQTLAGQGWELISVVPYVYRNEEHGGDAINPKPVVTQTYPAYFFQRLRATAR